MGMNYISIPGLGGVVQVGMNADFDPRIPYKETRSWDADKREATYQLADRKGMTNLTILAHLLFPDHTWKATSDEKTWHVSRNYTQTVRGTFTNIAQADGTLMFSDIGPIQLQGEPDFPGDAIQRAQESLFRYISGAALISASNNPGIAVIRIKLALGSSDGHSFTFEEEHKDAEWKVGGEVGKDGGKSDPKEAGVGDWVKDRVLGPAKRVLDTVRSLSGKVGGEYTSGSDTRKLGRQWTPAPFLVQPEWTLSLILPEPKPKPQPATGLTWHKVYYLTGQSEILSVKDKDWDKVATKENQIRALQRFLNTYQATVADRDFKYLEEIELIGHASGLGDTGGNVTLSDKRAKDVKKFIQMSYQGIIPDDKLKKIRAEGAPPEASNKDNNPEDRRVDVHLFFKK